MAVFRNSKISRNSRSAALPLLVTALLAAFSVSATAFFYSRGDLLNYGDAQAHLNIARRVLDSRTPGWEQIGTVWLPLPHVLMLPFVQNNWLWETGLAGAIPSGLCFVLAGLLLFLAARRIFLSDAAGIAACLLLALNPNLLYLQSLAMSEAIFMAALAAVLYFTVRFRERPSLGWAAAAGVAAAAGSLSRYEGWFLIPFVALYLLLAGERRRWTSAIVFSVIAAAGPLFWLAHNWWYYSNALEFYNGPYSAKAIYQRALDAGMARYPGDHDWAKAWLYFRTAVALCAGRPLVWLGVAGALAAAYKRAFWPLALLALAPFFYVLSLYSAGTPIFVPGLEPYTYYNSRYGLAALPLLALAGAALVAIAPERIRRLAAVAVVIVASVAWPLYPRPDGWICWKESRVNSEARRAWTAAAASFLRSKVEPSEGVITSFGDLAGIFPRAGIPLRQTLHQGNGLQWAAALGRPKLFLWETWAVAFSGDRVATALDRARLHGPRYDCVKTIVVKGAPVVKIYRRTP
jgi:4-amino-4-deoxy-L-arabinose transferase-like glycosyltransferase